jgi:hypothetical protein
VAHVAPSSPKRSVDHDSEVPCEWPGLYFTFELCVLLVIPSAAQQTTSSSPQALQLLQQSLAALQGNTSLTDVTLSGAARRIAGSDDETGTVTVKALAAGAARMDLNLSSGLRNEIMNISASPAGSWSGPDAIAHRIAYHNLLLIDPAWFFPLFPISRGLATGYTATYIGQETRNGKSVQHIAIEEASAVQTPAGTPSLSHLSQMDFFLDATTLVPAAATFNIHPDNDANRDIPIEVHAKAAGRNCVKVATPKTPSAKPDSHVHLPLQARR